MARAIWAVLLLVSPWASRAWNTCTGQSTLAVNSLVLSHTHNTYMLSAGDHEQSSLRGRKQVGQAAKGNCHILGLISTPTLDEGNREGAEATSNAVCACGQKVRTHTHTCIHTATLHTHKLKSTNLSTSSRPVSLFRKNSAPSGCRRASRTISSTGEEG